MLKILLAEDDLFIRDIYKEILESEKYIVVPASDGEKAFNLIKEGGWDIVFLDMMMPKKTGVEILKELKTLNSKKLAKHLLIMTNSEETNDIEEFKNIYDDYILKSSINPGELLERVKRYSKD